MRGARRLTVVAIGVVALATVTGASYGVYALSTSTDHAFRDRATPSPVAAKPTPTVAVTETTEPPTPPSTAPTPTVAPRPEPEPVLEPGDRGVQVRELQGRLSELAWFTPPMTGDYDPATRQGVRGFQDKRGLDATGTVDPATWKRLLRMTRMPSQDELFNRAGPALFERGDEGRDVREIQARLRQVAWFSGDVSDHYGDQTVESVRGFQAKRHVPVTGKVDRRTLDLLEGMTSDPTADEMANREPDPADGSPLDARCRTGRALCIDKSSSSLRWVVDGTVRMSLDVRFGAEYTPTREGLFSVYWKDRDHVSDLYGSEMPFSMFFSRGQAVHYSSDFAARGYAGASHGCVNVRDHTALSSLFDQVRTGDKVVVYRS
jgi:peptidoglycan hydrolase-like protein with peptidoglycan-binding domain